MTGVAELRLPRPGRRLEPYRTGTAEPVVAPSTPPASRVAYAAVHVVGDPLADADPILEPRLDWDATLAYRRYVWSLGLGVAEAMDTAQRGGGLDWPASRELIRRAVAEARATNGRIVCGAGTDQLEARPEVRLADVEAAYEEQVGFVEGEGGAVVLMASRALGACAEGPDDYARVYGKVLSQVRRPVILHWLGEAFDPALAGYWGCADPHDAADVALAVIAEHRDRVDGVKLSVLDRSFEVDFRRRLPEGVRMYTGDDFHYAELIRGDDRGHSDALLGIFDAIAPAAAAALQALDAGEADAFDHILAPTVPLARHIFRAPTYHYKTGLVFLAYLNGHQPHFRMVAGLEAARSVVHLAELFVLADRARLLRDPELATERMRRVLAVAGIE